MRDKGRTGMIWADIHLSTFCLLTLWNSCSDISITGSDGAGSSCLPNRYSISHGREYHEGLGRTASSTAP
jgi:hypothetical protein